MFRRIWPGVISLAAIFLFVGPAAAPAQILADSARQMDAGTWRVLVYRQGTIDQKLNFELGSSGSCTTAGATPVSFLCGSTGEVPAELSGEAVLAKLVVQPNDRVRYYVQAGVGNYRLETSSLSVVNKLSGDRPGFEYGAGFTTQLLPDTVVSPAFAVDVFLGWQRVYFNQLGGTGTIDERLDVLRSQVAIEASHRFEIDERVKVEPYGGVKWLRKQAWLKDLGRGGRAGGIEDSVLPFVGLKVPVFDKEGLFAEASFADGIQYAAGISVQFN